MRRLKDYPVPLQMGAYAVFPPALSARASWGQYLRWRPFPALDTGRPSSDQTLHKIKERKVVAPWHLADLQSVFRLASVWLVLRILPLSKKRAYGRRCIQRVTKER